MSPLLLVKFIFLLHLLKLSHCFDFTSTVSKDGKGDFTRVSDAIAAAPNWSSTRIYIYVKPGLYVEHIEVPRQKTFISLIGDDASKTVILDGRNNQHGSSTKDSATFTVNGDHFMAQFITFENSAGPKNGQAVAFYVEAERTSYYKCVFKGYQDTLLVDKKFHFFKECDVYGSVDFIFGNGLAVFQDCNVYARLSGAMTAQSKETAFNESGFTFQNCNKTSSPEVINKNMISMSLGRPWRSYSTVIIMQSFLDTVVNPKGWEDWGETPLNVLFYAEFRNYGPRADTSNRVNWPGYHVLHTDKEASKFTVDDFINGSRWLPETGIPFRGGLHG